MGGNKCQTYPGSDESKPVILVGLIHNTHLYASSDKHVGYVLVKIAPRPYDERFAVEIGELHTLPLREPMVFWSSQRSFEKFPPPEASRGTDPFDFSVAFIAPPLQGRNLADRD
jgi:hypothetical protein